MFRYALAVFIATFWLAGCTAMGDIRAHYQFVESELKANPAIEQGSFEFGNTSLHFASRGEARTGIVLWLHGTPGAWTEAGRLFVDEALLAEVLLVSVDRPGWGKSRQTVQQDLQQQSPGSRQGTDSFEAQSVVLEAFVQHLREQYPGVPLYLAGHSWGASLAPWLAATNPQAVDGLVLFAGAYDPELARPRWYHRWAATALLKKLLGSALNRANDEMLALPVGLQKLAPTLNRLDKLPIIALQGGRDGLVHPQNLAYLQARLGQGEYIFDGPYGHLWPMDRADVVADCLLAMVQHNVQRCRDAVALKSSSREG